MTVGIIKLIHISFAMMAIIGFVSRGLLMMLESPLMQSWWIKRVPHFIDSALLISALVLAVQMGFTPTNSPWLAAKLVALVFYIVFGTIALRRGRTKQIRIFFFLAALLAFAYIVLVAISKSPLPFL